MWVWGVVWGEGWCVWGVTRTTERVGESKTEAWEGARGVIFFVLCGVWCEI